MIFQRNTDWNKITHLIHLKGLYTIFQLTLDVYWVASCPTILPVIRLYLSKNDEDVLSGKALNSDNFVLFPWRTNHADKDLKGTIVNQTSRSIHGGSFEIASTVNLIKKRIVDCVTLLLHLSGKFSPRLNF